MASRYDPTLSRDVDKVRLLIGDTNSAVFLMEDDEIQYFVTAYTDLKMAASHACRVVAAKFARDVNYRFSTLWQDSSDAYKHYMDLAERYADEAGSENMEGPKFATSSDFVENNPIFHIGMNDNPPTLTEAEKDYLGIS